LLAEYYAFDMQELREEVDHILSNESEKIQKEKEDMSLAQDHIAKGSNFKIN
jgi:hypothetical protein